MEKDPEKVEVKYQGAPDWIETSDEDTSTELTYTNANLDGEAAWDLEEER